VEWSGFRLLKKSSFLSLASKIILLGNERESAGSGKGGEGGAGFDPQSERYQKLVGFLEKCLCRSLNTNVCNVQQAFR